MMKRLSPFTFLFGLAIFIFLIARLDLHSSWDRLKQVNLGWLLFALSFAVPEILFKSLRLKSFVAKASSHISLKNSVLSFLSGQPLASVTPGKLGNVTRIVLLNRFGKIPMPTALAVHAADRIYDLAAILLLAIIGLVSFILQYHQQLGSALAVVIGMVAGMFLVLIFLNPRWMKFVLKPLVTGLLSKKLADQLSHHAKQFYNSLHTLLIPSFKIFGPFSLSFLAWETAILRSYFLSVALGLPLPFLKFVLLVPVMVMIELLPISILGLGPREAALFMLFTTDNLHREDLLAFSFLMVAAGPVFTALIGIPAALQMIPNAWHTMTRLNYSVVIAIDRPDKAISSVASLMALPKDERPSEIFVSVGHNPSLQRNEGLSQCKSPLVYFLDEDSWVIPGTAHRLMSHFEGQRSAVAGGPNLPFPDATDFEKTVSSVLASWMGSFKVRNRYASIGSVKDATEKDLILCNMMVRKEIFKKEGGFSPHLYPNEENEFLNRLLHVGYQLIYDPAAAVYRPRRKSLWAFCYQAFRYGRGRARQMKVYPCLSDTVHLVPAFFLFYLISLAAPFVISIPSAWLGLFRTQLWWSPFYLFALLAIGTGVSTASWHRRFLDFFKVPVLILLRHSFYGVGLIAGLFSPIPKPPLDVKVFQVKPQGKTYRLQAVPAKKKRAR